MVNVPGLPEAWSRDLNLTSRQLQGLGPAPGGAPSWDSTAG